MKRSFIVILLFTIFTSLWAFLLVLEDDKQLNEIKTEYPYSLNVADFFQEKPEELGAFESLLHQLDLNALYVENVPRESFFSKKHVFLHISNLNNFRETFPYYVELQDRIIQRGIVQDISFGSFSALDPKDVVQDILISGSQNNINMLLERMQEGATYDNQLRLYPTYLDQSNLGFVQAIMGYSVVVLIVVLFVVCYFVYLASNLKQYALLDFMGKDINTLATIYATKLVLFTFLSSAIVALGIFSVFYYNAYLVAHLMGKVLFSVVIASCLILFICLIVNHIVLKNVNSVDFLKGKVIYLKGARVLAHVFLAITFGASIYAGSLVNRVGSEFAGFSVWSRTSSIFSLDVAWTERADEEADYFSKIIAPKLMDLYLSLDKDGALLFAPLVTNILKDSVESSEANFAYVNGAYMSYLKEDPKQDGPKSRVESKINSGSRVESAKTEYDLRLFYPRGLQIKDKTIEDLISTYNSQVKGIKKRPQDPTDKKEVLPREGSETFIIQGLVIKTEAYDPLQKLPTLNPSLGILQPYLKNLVLLEIENSETLEKNPDSFLVAALVNGYFHPRVEEGIYELTDVYETIENTHTKPFILSVTSVYEQAKERMKQDVYMLGLVTMLAVILFCAYRFMNYIDREHYWESNKQLHSVKHFLGHSTKSQCVLRVKPLKVYIGVSLLLGLGVGAVVVNYFGAAQYITVGSALVYSVVAVALFLGIIAKEKAYILSKLSNDHETLLILKE